MSDDLDFDMETVEEDELDELGADGTAASETDRKEEATAESAGFEMEVAETNDPDPVTTRSDSRRKDDERSRITNSTSEANSGQEIFGLGSVPKEWEVRSLPSVVGVEMGSSPPSSTYNEEERGIPFYQGNADFGHMTPKVSTWCSDPVKTADKDDVLISIRAPVGDLNVADEHCCIGRGLAALRPKEVNGLYLFYGLAQRSRWLSRLASGSTFKSVSSADLEKVDLPVPPLPEQRKIASVLYAVDQAIQKTEAIIEQAEKIRDGVINGLFEIDGVEKVSSPDYNSPRFQSILSRREETWEESERERWEAAGEKRSIDSTKYTSPLGLGKKRLPELPDDWEWVPLDLFVAYDIDYRGKTPPYSDAGVPVISSGNLQEGKVVFEDPRYVSPSTYDEWLDRGVPREGDLIVTTEAPVGKVALYPEGKYLPTRRIIVLRTVGVDNRYLKAAMNHPAVQNYLATQSRGTTVPRILKDYLLRTPIPFPPQKEHDQITEVLKHLDAKLGKERSAQSRLKRLKTGLMQDLLTGKVRTADKAIDVLDEVVEHG